MRTLPFADQSQLSDTTYNEKWDAEKFTINARLMLNRVNRRVNAINPAALILSTSRHDVLCRFQALASKHLYERDVSTSQYPGGLRARCPGSISAWTVVR